MRTIKKPVGKRFGPPQPARKFVRRMAGANAASPAPMVAPPSAAPQLPPVQQPAMKKGGKMAKKSCCKGGKIKKGK